MAWNLFNYVHIERDVLQCKRPKLDRFIKIKLSLERRTAQYISETIGKIIEKYGANNILVFVSGIICKLLEKYQTKNINDFI